MHKLLFFNIYTSNRNQPNLIGGSALTPSKKCLYNETKFEA